MYQDIHPEIYNVVEPFVMERIIKANDYKTLKMPIMLECAFNIPNMISNINVSEIELQDTIDWISEDSTCSVEQVPKKQIINTFACSVASQIISDYQNQKELEELGIAF